MQKPSLVVPRKPLVCSHRTAFEARSQNDIIYMATRRHEASSLSSCWMAIYTAMFAAGLALAWSLPDAVTAEARRMQRWIQSAERIRQTSRAAPRDWATVDAEARFPAALVENSRQCTRMPMADALQLGAEALQASDPMLLTNASHGWRLHEWALNWEALAESIGEASPLRMKLFPTDVAGPTLDVEHGAMVEPANHGVFFSDYLTLLDRLAVTEELGVYVAQMMLFEEPWRSTLLSQVCLPSALPPSHIDFVGAWLGGHSVKNGLHFDHFDNLLYQITGRKRALLYPPEDAPNLYYGGELSGTQGGAVPTRRHQLEFDSKGTRFPTGFARTTRPDAARSNVAMIDVFDPKVGSETHLAVRDASPMLCELGEGDALFIPRRWHHSVISTSRRGQRPRNVAINLWYRRSEEDTRNPKSSPRREREAGGPGALEAAFQQEGCPRE